MLKKIISTLVFLFIVTNFLNAESRLVKLINVDLSDASKLEKIELLNLAVIDINETELITIADDFQFAQLVSEEINFNVIKGKIDLSKLYILSGKRNQKLDEINISAEEFYKFSNNVIIVSETGENIESDLLGKIPVSEIKRTFKNVKSVFNTVQSDEIDALITSVVEDVDSGSVEYYIQGLQDFGTRFLRHPNRKEVALWIKNEFEIMGYTDVVLDSFSISGYMQYNVVATYPSAVPSTKYIVVGGHHDSITNQSLSDTFAPAPGADDNASGTTAVLESARVLKANNFESEVNIKFVTFAAEELGLYGGFDYARFAANSGMDVKLMINHDMISNNKRSLSNSVVDINYYSGSDAFSQLAYQNVGKFTRINAEFGSGNSSGSDSYAFWQNGFNAIYFEERDFSSFYHTSEDLIHHYDMSFCSEVVRASVATLISTSVAPSPVSNFTIADVGNGTSLYMEWQANTDYDLAGYKIFVGTSDGSYTDEFETVNNYYTVEGLTEGTLYYVGVAAIDSDNYESVISQRSMTPNQNPLAPSGIEIEPVWMGVKMMWAPNKELDIAGYNVYRSGIDTEEIIKLNDQLITDNTFTDNTIESGVYYEYIIRAVDTDQNESMNTDYLISRGVTLDQGILLVDETADGDGAVFSPTDEEVDSFYENMINNYNYTTFDLKTVGKINLSDLGAYNVIIWYGDDKTDQSAMSYRDDIRKYLEFGGKFLYSGYRPSKTFEGVSSLSKTFSEGDFLYDCFKINKINYSLIGKFNGALSQADVYTDLFLDQNKVSTMSDLHINGIETFDLVNSMDEIYEYGSTYATNLPQGSLVGGTVGSAYFGEDFSSVILSFPLYYIDQNSATSFVNYILNNKFGLTTDIENEEAKIPTSFSLMQNYPNPFNPTTKIKYQVSSIEKVSLKIYDILGREIAKLVNELQAPGTYEVEFDASKLSSGVYFYSLNAGEFSAVKKLLLLK